jgi:hypothetical protein
MSVHYPTYYWCSQGISFVITRAYHIILDDVELMNEDLTLGVQLEEQSHSSSIWHRKSLELLKSAYPPVNQK